MLTDAELQDFKDRNITARSLFRIERISKNDAYNFVKVHHYLGDAKFFSMDQFGLFTKSDGELVGVATYSLPQGNVALKGWFGLSNDCHSVLELSRLAMHPKLNGTNATSFLLGGTLRVFKRERNQGCDHIGL